MSEKKALTDSERPQRALRGRIPLTLVILDGVGVGIEDEFDAVAVAKTPNLTALTREHLSCTIFANGLYVGLPSQSDMGNSEVGHNIMGAGRVLDQGAKRVDVALSDGALWGSTWRELVAVVREHGSSLHLVGLLSDGNIHASIKHLFAMLDKAADEGIDQVRVHVLLDGRDVPDRTALEYLNELDEKLSQIAARGNFDFRIASGGGRMTTTMDRYEADWRIVERGWHAHVLGDARPFKSAQEAVQTFRRETPGISDQLLPSFSIVGEEGAPIGAIKDNDAVVIFNFRGDRAMELAQAFTKGDDFRGFDRQHVPRVFFAGMTLYDGDTNTPERRLMEPPKVPGTVSELLADAGVIQLACAETQKFGHVTYFWNGNRSEKFADNEKYVEITSDRVDFSERPWMKSAETADVVTDAVQNGGYDFIRLNFPGGDMVGHTGNFDATVVALEAIDLALGRIVHSVKQQKGCFVLTADHGNAEDMVERDAAGRPQILEGGSPRWKTAHSVNKVPFIVADFSGRDIVFSGDISAFGLANLGATLLTLLGVEVPRNYAPSMIELVTR